MPKISLCILAMNEADKIAHALASAKAAPWCDEVVVFDSGSTDATPDICRDHGARVVHEPWVSFSANRQKLIAAAANDWVFILDADEELSPDLINQIAAMPDAMFRAHPIFELPRRNYLLARHVRAWDPDRVARLVDRSRVTWPDRAIHDRPSPTAGSIGQLAGPILHNRHSRDFDDYFDGVRYQRRADALAREMLAAGRRVGFLGLWLRPQIAFWKFYLLKGGILRGSFGLLVAQKAAFSVQLKYARLWHLQQQQRTRSNGDPAE